MSDSTAASQNVLKKHPLISGVVAAVAVLAIGGTVAGNASSDDDSPSTTTSNDSDVVVDTSDTVTTTTTTSDTDTEAPSSYAVGDTAEVDGWTASVTKVVLNANADISLANQFNDKPTYQYVLVTVTGTNNQDSIEDLSWVDAKILGSDGVVYRQAAVVTPADDADTPTEAGKGGTVSTQYAFDVPQSALANGAYIVLGDDDVRFAL